MADLPQLDNHEFVSLETFRKNGVGVKTPIWFAQDGGMLYMWTAGESGKVKRIRNNPRVNIAPCKRLGEVTGEWAAAHATVDDSADVVRHVEKLLRRKVGVGFAVFQLIDRLRDRQQRRRRVCVKVSLN
ncbi:MAG: PPOX class F420-dependent oxidoreductase [Chloroflexota bacterium]